MSYIGQQLPADTFSGFVTDAFTGDGSATTFTLSKAPFSENTLIVVINNVIQRPTTNFTVSGTTLTIVGTAVASGDIIYAIHLGGPVASTLASKVDVNGLSDGVVLDADADTTISADTDDQIDVKIGGTDALRVTGTALTGNALATIGAAGTASTVAGIPLFSDSSNKSMYTHDVSGTDSTAAGNTAFGFTAMDAITTGDDNTAMGENALGGLEDGTENVAIGKNSMLAATSASQNTCVGLNSGTALSSGSGYNVLLGHGAGAAMTTGNRNIAIGVSSMDGFDTEAHNLGIGVAALGGSVAGGEYNVAVGNYTLDALTSADFCTAVGYQAGSALTTGGYTTAVGYQALGSGNVTGSYNTAVGMQAMNNTTSGANNVAVGYGAGNDALNTITTSSNVIVIGNNSNSAFVAKVDVTAGSDRRDKTDIEDLPEAAGLSFVNKLRPVTYVWDNRSNYYHHTHEKYGERDHSKKELRVHPGFISQEVKELEKSIGWEDDHIVNTENDNSWKLKYSALIPLLTKAIQELSAKVEALEDKI